MGSLEKDASASSASGHKTRILPIGRSAKEYYEPFPPNHFAPKAGHQKLDIAIIGAGIAGLTAAVALLQSGHNVEVFERSRFGNEIGAAINMCPNASRILSYYEFDFAQGMPTPVEEFILMDANNLKVLRNYVTPDYEHLYGAPWLLFHRVDLHNGLKRLATIPRPSTAAVANVNLASEIADIDLAGNITLADGTKMKKDLIVVADGIRTKFASKVVHEDESVRAIPTGTAVYRFLIPTERLLADPQTKRFYSGEKQTLVIAPHDDVRLVWYPCRGGAIQNYGFFHPDTIEGYEDEVWNIPASPKKFMQQASKLHPDFQAVLSMADDLKLWRLCEREKPIRTLTKGNVVLVGDAAHPMLPHQGQGGGMAVEDAAALGVLFSDLRSKEEISARLNLFQELRLERVSAMQILSSVGQDEHMKIADKLRPYFKGTPPTTQSQYHDNNFTPNVLRDAKELLERYQSSLSEHEKL